MAQVRQAKSQVEDAVITHRVVNKCRVSIKRAITPIGKVHPPYHWSNTTWWMVEEWDRGWDAAHYDNYDDD